MKKQFAWKDKCECGHSRHLHEHVYDGGKITKIEGCNVCACKMFKIKENKTEKGDGLYEK